MRVAENIPNPTAQAPQRAPDLKSEERNQRLLRLFAELGPGRLQALDNVWDLCAADLHGLALWRTGSPQDAEDALQEVFIRLAKAAEGDRLGEVRKPFAYLLRMVHSTAVDTLRQRKRHQGKELAEAPDYLEASLERAAEATRLSQHLVHLPEKQRAVVYLRHFVDLPFREIAQVMGTPTFTAASRYRLALRRLRKIMGVKA